MPHPVSFTTSRSVPVSGVSGSHPYSTVMLPSFVNFAEFPTKLMSTWRNPCRDNTTSGTSIPPVRRTTRFTPLSAAR